MSEIGQTSQLRVEEIPVLRENIPVPGEEEARDIQVVSEQLVVVPEQRLEEEGEEDPEELTYEQLHAENVELREQIRDMEEVLESRQIIIKEKEGEVHELEVQQEQLLRENEEIKSENDTVESENNELRAEIVQLKTTMEELKETLKEETDKRSKAEDAHIRVSQRADHAEGKVRAKKFKIDVMKYIFHTLVDRTQDRIYYYPVQLEDHLTFVDRHTVSRIMEQEREEAVRRGLSS